jgi:hypothetical protein
MPGDFVRVPEGEGEVPGPVLGSCRIKGGIKKTNPQGGKIHFGLSYLFNIVIFPGKNRVC